jgi:hypothetical protein
MPAGTEGRVFDDFLRPAALPSRRFCGRRATWEPTDRIVNGGSMDLVVVAILAALAALSFLWLRFVEKA